MDSSNPTAVALGVVAGMSSLCILPEAFAPAAGASFAALLTALSYQGDLAYFAIPAGMFGGLLGLTLGPIATSVAVGYTTHAIVDSVMEYMSPTQKIVPLFDKSRKSAANVQAALEPNKPESSNRYR